MNTLFENTGKAPGLKNNVRIVFTIEFSATGIKGTRLWQKMITSPMMPIVFIDALSNKLRMIKPNPIAAITSKRMV